MTDDIGLTEHDDAASPSPPERSPKLQALEALVGDWLLGDPSAAVGRTSFSWLQGGFFLIQRWTVDIPEVPDGIAILGEDATTGGLFQHYYDSRGIARVYEMSLEDGVWKLWRNGPDFWQRFTGKLGEDGATITGTWESSPDGSSWQHDFDLVYTRTSYPRMPPEVILREVAGDPEELAALQRVMESDEDYALRVTGHPPGPADAQSTLLFVPEGSSPDDKAPFGVWAEGELVGVLDLLLRYPDEETIDLGLLLIERGRQGQGLGRAAVQALEREVAARWPWARRLRLSVVRTNDNVLGFWRRMGFTETGEVRPWRYDKLQSEAILMDKPITDRPGSAESRR